MGEMDNCCREILVSKGTHKTIILMLFFYITGNKISQLFGV